MIKQFAPRLLDWFDQCGRKDLPWQHDADPYKIWLSEVMLQQTQVSTVIPYFERFIARFPSVQSLAAAQQDEVLHLWSGLGYYARGRNLHAAAKKVVEQFASELPADQAQLESLPGIGRSTAGAILAQAFEQPAAILDGNVKRLLTRLEGIAEWPGNKKTTDLLWHLSETLLPTQRLRDYTQAIMDLGATCCTRGNPDCQRCPFRQDCQANLQSLQASIPARKPRKAKPIRETVFLILVNNCGQLLLEKRPQIGIWGGLWSFPEFDIDDQDGIANRIASLGVEIAAKQQWLESGSHVFSHFQLNYRPLLVQVNTSLPMQINEADQQIWYSDAVRSQTNLQIGLAAPVAMLLKKIQEYIDE